MKRIASFSVDHDLIGPGMYISRKDGDVVTYDIRMKKPNGGDYLGVGETHTIEHLFATFARNGGLADKVVYVGPMGCRTGFYLLLRDSVPPKEAIGLVRDSMAFIAGFEGHSDAGSAGGLDPRDALLRRRSVRPAGADHLSHRQENAVA